MRPMLKSALRRSWRGRESVQFGVVPERAVVLEPVDGAAAGFLDLLDGTRGPETLARDAGALGLGPERVRQLLGLLADGGVLEDASAHAWLAEVVRHRAPVLDRLRPDLAALSLLHPGPGAAAARIRHRRAARVRVHGAGRVGSALAAVLSAAGVGSVDLVDGGRVEPWDVAPGGIPADHIGDRRDAAGRGVVRRASPGTVPRGGTRTGAGTRAGPGSAVTVLAPRDGLYAYAPDPGQARRLVAAGVPHLYPGVVEGMGVVGPLVVPGRTACGECVGLGRADVDPQWPLMLAQLRSGRQPAVPACDIALATTVAGLAAAHVLAYLDGRVPPSLGARVELSLGRLSSAVRELPGHERCGCGAAERERARAQVPGTADGVDALGTVDGSDEDEALRWAVSDGLHAGTPARRGTMGR